MKTLVSPNGLVVVSNIFLFFTENPWGNYIDPICRACFFNWVGSTTIIHHPLTSQKKSFGWQVGVGIGERVRCKIGIRSENVKANFSLVPGESPFTSFFLFFCPRKESKVMTILDKSCQ